ncbi:SHOCT domain-containing protein [Phycicoccus sp. M110.8]|uniref:SHOCT domain-containing protein n=1 Tax=Phycicoccus sp. M110.8 TaxID=3075433 RepID=UPI0028FD3F76|nr:SHOCT domain-containing protein [Phycicoccus sp. M110.8]MDU0314165.1 SHOCT domain-containing protein [Phycicoccus sp. M110.8]
MSFWDIVWFIFITYALVAYLMVMFSIVVDLVRDKGTSGVAKALWVVFLIFMPFLAPVVYLIARGWGMSDRAAKDAVQVRQQQEDYIRSLAGPSTPCPTDQIAQAKTMLDNGVISDAEFNTNKAKALT